VEIGKTVRGGRPCDDVQHDMMSRRLDARSFGAAVRVRWGSKTCCTANSTCHSGEDQSRIGKGHAVANLSVIRGMALPLRKNERSQKVGVKTKRLTAGWNNNYLGQVLFGT
jgi:hypothetical protein